VGFFIIYSPLLFMSPSENQCIILYIQKKRKRKQTFRQSLIMGFDVVILSSPFFFQITFFCTLFYLVIKLFTIDTRAFVYLYPFCIELFSIAHEFNAVDSWRNPTFYFVTSYLFNNMVVYMTFKMNILISMDFNKCKEMRTKLITFKQSHQQNLDLHLHKNGCSNKI
jgi:hypothetical protein